MEIINVNKDVEVRIDNRFGTNLVMVSLGDYNVSFCVTADGSINLTRVTNNLVECFEYSNPSGRCFVNGNKVDVKGCAV